MGQQTLGGKDTSRLREEYRQRVMEELPATAAEAGDWPIREDHCFGRVVLDTLFEDGWTDYADGSPAYEQLSATELPSTIEIADRMLAEGKPVVEELNEKSLRWRNK